MSKLIYMFYAIPLFVTGMIVYGFVEYTPYGIVWIFAITCCIINVALYALIYLLVNITE